MVSQKPVSSTAIATLIALLGAEQQRSGLTALAQLLERARTQQWRIRAENAAFNLKDQLKARGYRLNGEAIDGPKAWYVDVAEPLREAEITFLRDEINRSEVDPVLPPH